MCKSWHVRLTFDFKLPPQDAVSKAKLHVCELNLPFLNAKMEGETVSKFMPGEDTSLDRCSTMLYISKFLKQSMRKACAPSVPTRSLCQVNLDGCMILLHAGACAPSAAIEYNRAILC